MKKSVLTILLLQSIIYYSFAQMVNGDTSALTVDKAIQIALEYNRGLRVASLEVERSKEQVRVQRSNALPSVNFAGQYAYYFKRPVFFGFGEESSGSEELPYARIGGENQFAAGVTLVQPLYSPAVNASLKSAKLGERRSQFSKSAGEAEVVAEVKRTYLQLLVLQERLKVQNESLRRNRKVLQDARSLYLQGRALRVDTLRAFTTVQNLQPDIVRITNALRSTSLYFQSLLGSDDSDGVALRDSLVVDRYDVIPTEEEIFEKALAQRPDLHVLAIGKDIAAEEVNTARAGKLPTLSLLGQYQLLTQQNDLRLGDSRWPSVAFAGLQLNIPIYNGSLYSSRVRQAKLSQDQQVLQYDDAVQQLRVATRRVVSGLHETSERLRVQGPVKETAQLSYNIIQFRYQKGVASRLELTDAELALTTAQLNYLEAVYDHLNARIELDRLLGISR
jgi:outer membrane protein TolC